MVPQRKRRLFLGLAVALALAVSPAVAYAGNGSFAVGGGSLNVPGSKFNKFAFSAHTGPQGDFGSFRYTVESSTGPLDVHVDVDCVHVYPNPPGTGARIGGPATKVAPQPNIYGIEPGEQFIFTINDFGNPSGPIPDEFVPGFGLPPQICKLLGPSGAVPITQGNIVINTG
jgi:hypothetical protein